MSTKWFGTATVNDKTPVRGLATTSTIRKVSNKANKNISKSLLFSGMIVCCEGLEGAFFFFFFRFGRFFFFFSSIMGEILVHGGRWVGFAESGGWDVIFAGRELQWSGS